MCSVSESCTSFAFAFVMVGERALCRYEVRSGRGEASSAETGLESALQFSQRAYISEYFRKQNAFTCTPSLKFSLNSLQMFGITVLMNYYPLHRTLLTSPVLLVRCWFISYHGSVVRSSSCKFSCGVNFWVLNSVSVCLQGVVWGLLSEKEDMALLISRFQEYLEMDDVRYYVMNATRDNIHRVMDRNKRVCMWRWREKCS